MTVTLETGDTDRTCTFTVSNSTTGTCNYTVQAGDTSADLTVSSISGTIADQSSNAMVNFVPVTNLAANKAIVILSDTTGPVISGINVVIKHPPGADITWTTDEGGTSYVEYGLTDAYGSNTTLDAAFVTAHTATISGLSQVTTYHYRIVSEDALGNSTTTADDVFTTSGATPGVGSKNEPIAAVVEKTEEKKEAASEKEESTSEKEESTPTPSTDAKSLLEVIKERIETIFNSGDEEVCTVNPYLRNPIKWGSRKNNPEDVKLLEQFLNRYENAGLVVDGVYSRTDFNAVIKWQEKHANDILKPWGIKKGTGNINKTSLAKIKEIEEGVCK